MFDVGDPLVGPFPADALTVPDPTQKTGLRVNLPLPACGEEPSSCAEVGELNRLDGFSLSPRTTVRFSAPVSLHSVEMGVYFVWLDNLTAEEPGLRPEGHTTQINQLVYSPATNAAHFKPNEVFDQHRRYLLVVTQDVRDEQGDAVERDPAFDACLTQPDGDYCDRLSAAVLALDDPSGVVAASLFTTLSATAWLEGARDQVDDTEPNFRPVGEPNVYQFGDLLGITVRTETGPGLFDDFTVPAPAFVLPNIDRVAFGVYESPNYLDGNQLIPTGPTGQPPPAPNSTTDIFFQAALPAAAPPEQGYPVAIVAHGLGDSRLGGPVLVANGLAAEGFATLAISAVGHGGGPNGIVRLTQAGGGLVELPLGGRSIDRNDDGTIEGREGCIVFEPVPAGIRDCLRQTVVDLMQLVRLIQSGLDLDGAAGIPLDASRIYFAGQSLGAVTGSLLHAIEPDIRAAVLNVGGGSVVDISRHSDELGEIAIGFLANREPALLNDNGSFNDDYPIRNQPPRVISVPGALEIQTVFERAEWAQMPGDPLAFATHLSRSSLPGVPAKPTLFQIALGDTTVPNPENSALVRAAGARMSTQVYRHDLARAAVPQLRENPHPFLVDFEALLGVGGEVARAAQAQIAGYFASDGATIPDVNPLVAGRFGFDIFEFPQVLPDNFGDDEEAVTVSAGSFVGPNLSAASIASAFAPNVATGFRINDQLPLPTSLMGTVVRIIDSEGRIHYGSFFFVDFIQTNFFIPDGVALGPAEVVISNADGVISRGVIVIAPIAPGVFTANASGEGIAAAQFISIAADDTRVDGLTFDCSAGIGNCVGIPIDLGGDGDEVFLVLFATGVRGRSDLSAVRATIDGREIPVLFAGDQGFFLGLDQFNLGPISRDLIGRGEVEIVIIVDGVVANVVTVVIQ